MQQDRRGKVGGRLDRGLGLELGAGRGLSFQELSAGAAAVGLEAVGRLWLDLQGLPPLGWEELLCEVGAGGRAFYTLRAAPARQ